jgi:tRNA threonylcarbamoyladenosine biosynthesis protein TsaB
MIVLGIETATMICSVGVAKDEHVIGEICLAVKNIHAEALSESIRDLLGLLQIPFSDLGGVAVSIGPGSFTGLRIGLATAKGLAFSIGKPIVSIDTLLAQAAAAQLIRRHEFIVPVIRSRQNEVYAARYRVIENELKLIEHAQVFTLKDFFAWLKAPAVLCGNGVAMLTAAGLHDHKTDIEVIPEAACPLSGGKIAELGMKRLKRGEADDVAAVEPRYVQEFRIESKAE